MKRTVHLIIILTVGLLLLAACGGGSQDSAEEEVSLSQTQELPNFGYTINYPEGYFTISEGTALTISESAAQAEAVFTAPPLESYSIDFFYDSLENMQQGGLPEDPTARDVMAFNVAAFGVPEPTVVEDITIFGVPAVRIETTATFADPAWPLVGIMGVHEGRAFSLVLHSPDEEARDAFQPIWEQMLDSIQAVES